jgi:hypothetical protein
MSTEHQHFEAARQFQAYYEETLRQVGTQAPPPKIGQSVNDYRRETLRQLKRNVSAAEPSALWRAVSWLES